LSCRSSGSWITRLDVLTGLSVFLAKGFLSMLMTCVDFFFPMDDWLMESSGLARVSIIIFVIVSQTGDSSQPDPGEPAEELIDDKEVDISSICLPSFCSIHLSSLTSYFNRSIDFFRAYFLLILKAYDLN
jgi:hypothetical protein